MGRNDGADCMGHTGFMCLAVVMRNAPARRLLPPAEVAKFINETRGTSKAGAALSRVTLEFMLRRLFGEPYPNADTFIFLVDRLLREVARDPADPELPLREVREGDAGIGGDESHSDTCIESTDEELDEATDASDHGNDVGDEGSTDGNEGIA